VLLENLDEVKLCIYEMGLYIINLMQLRENKPRLRNITFFYRQNKVQYMLPLRLLLHQSPFYSQFTRFMSSFSPTLVLIGIDAQVTSLWQVLHLQTLSSPAIGFDFTNRDKRNPRLLRRSVLKVWYQKQKRGSYSTGRGKNVRFVSQ
jgi:hypothetical protein